MAEKSSTNFFGVTTFRNERKRFGIKTDDRRRHFYCIGKTGMGKSNLMENMAIQDIQENRGIAYVDPHGEGAEKLLDFIPASRINDVIFFNPADLDYPIAFNVMEKVDFRFRHLIAGGLMGVFKKVWPDVWSARMEYILNNAILALLEYPDATLLGVNRMLADVEYREKVVSKITDPIVKSFWVTEYARYTQRYEIEATAAIQNKVGQFISNPLIRNIIGQTKSTIDMRDIMDKEKIFIMDLSKGRIGEDNSRLLGALLITKLQLAAMSRVDIPEEDRKDFYLYVDEFQNFATESFANILSEARKYRLNITLGHQYITRMEEEVRDAVFGNVGTMAVFRVGAEDAEFLEREFSPQFTAEDLVNLPKYNVYLKLMIDGISGQPFSAETLPPPMALEDSNREKIIRASRERYGVRREIVDEKISRWSGFGPGGELENSAANSRMAQAPQRMQNPQRSNFQQGQQGQGEQKTLYDAICSNCGKSTKVIFPPEPGRAVYCKSCLKKLKAGNEPAKAVSANKPAEKPAVREERPEGHPEKEVKVEKVSFNASRKPAEPRNEKPAVKPKRKEINLADLRQALEESLKNKSKPAPEPKGIPEESMMITQEVPKTKKESPKEELQDRIEEEKGEDLAEEEPDGLVIPKKEEKPVPPAAKKVIKPGETIKL
jgi:CxxC-x17-CxxC domain-containing protein